MYLQATLEKCLFKHFCQFLIRTLFLSLNISIFRIQPLIRYIICKYSLSLCGFSLHSLDSIFEGYLNFNQSDSSALLFVLFVPNLPKHCLIRGQNINLCVFPFKSFIVLSLIFRSLIYFELSFLHGIRQGSNFILLPVNIQLSPALFVKKIILFLLKHISTILFISFLLSFHTLLIILVKNSGVGTISFPRESS